MPHSARAVITPVQFQQCMKFLALVFIFVFFNSLHADAFNSTICQGNNDLLNTLTNLPGCIVDSFFNYTVSGLIASSQGIVDSTFRFMFSSPDPAWFCSSYNGIMAVVETLYTLVLMGLALYFILRSNDAEGRATAKRWLENMLVMIVVLAFSFQIFQVMLDLNTYLATSFANESMKSIFQEPVSFTSAVFALVILIPSLSAMLLTFITLLVRYLLIPFLLFLFPIAIFLYFVPVTQKWGRAFLVVIAAVVFMTAFDALVLFGLSSLFNSPDPNLADSLAHALAVLFGFGALGLVNLLIFILAILSILFQNNSIRGVVGLAVAGKVLTR